MSILPTLLVIGSGPGIGVSTTSLFAKNRFDRIAILSRSSSRLETDKKAILSSLPPSRTVEVATWSVDITKSTAFKNVLGEVEKWTNGNLECVLYNAARVDFSTLTEFEESGILYDFMTTTIALHTAFTWALPLLQKAASSSTSAKPSFLVTSSLLWKHPIPQMFSLCLSKAAQRSLVTSLQMTYPDIYIVLLNVGGPVGEDCPHFNPRMVATKWWEVYQRDKKEWTLDVDMLGNV